MHARTTTHLIIAARSNRSRDGAQSRQPTPARRTQRTVGARPSRNPKRRFGISEVPRPAAHAFVAACLSRYCDGALGRQRAPEPPASIACISHVDLAEGAPRAIPTRAVHRPHRWLREESGEKGMRGGNDMSATVLPPSALADHTTPHRPATRRGPMRTRLQEPSAPSPARRPPCSARAFPPHSRVAATTRQRRPQQRRPQQCTPAPRPPFLRRLLEPAPNHRPEWQCTRP
ncbi:hypothetical protein SAMN05216270_114117 [Glycomyces harbinensis]|uniref:Uncharacterized protein n=1 Tax=Glycomyces harbinensis TaxID=58114 RepID=A0A1G7AS13_9ACTN|nr:hypothetical protein SAMN05216270_114117 [Glycomyces harbinensis]